MSNRDGNTNQIINYHKCTCFKHTCIQKCIVLYKNTKYILYYIINPKIIGACLLTFYNITLTNPIVVAIHV